MSRTHGSNLRHLSQCLRHREDLEHFQRIFDKIQKCCAAVDRKLNLADILNDSKNQSSLDRLFGDSYDIGLQILLKVSLSEYSSQSFKIKKAIQGTNRLDFLHSSLGSLKQANIVLTILKSDPSAEEPPLLLVNPQRQEHWQNLKEIPSDSLISVFVKAQSPSVEEEIAQQVREAFSAADREVLPEVPKSTQKAPLQPRPMKREVLPSLSRSPKTTAKTGPLAATLKVQVSKMDTFIHAGNAQLILKHLQDYSGRAEMFVMRGEKVPVQLDADSIWGAEIRNGEIVLFEFFGEHPGEGYLRELSQKTNKYTQMDKVANE